MVTTFKYHIVAVLNDLEVFLEKDNRFKFNSFPLFRIQLGYYLSLLNNNKFNATSNNETSLKELGFSEVVLLIKLKLLLIWLKIKNKNTLKNKVLFYGFKNHYYKQDNGLMENLYITPIKKILINEGNISEELTPDSSFSHSASTKTESYYSLLLQYHRLLFKFKNKYFKIDKEYTEACLALESFFKQHEVAHSVHFTKLMYNVQVNQQIHYNVFKDFLNTTKPKLVWSYCFYENSTMALSRAANLFNIKFIEYQHSQQSDEHFAYAKWNHIDIYKEYFPSTFWVWEQRDADRVKKNFEGENYKPNIIVGGNIAVIQEKEKYIEKAADAEKGILVSLQGVWMPEFVEKVIEQDTEHTWYFRLHPRYPEDKQKMIDFKNRFPAKVEIEMANSLSLYQLFTMVKANVVDFSGTALEAEQFGVKNIVIGKRGREVYADKVQVGLFYFTDNEKLLKQTIETIKGIDVDFKKSVLDEREKLKKIAGEVFA